VIWDRRRLSAERWHPHRTYSRYVHSASRGEFAIEKERQEGEFIYVYSYFYGGIDWSALSSLSPLS